MDLIFTDKKRSFKNICAIDTGVSDFHRMVFTQLKLTFQKLPPKTIFYRDYKHFVKEDFENDLIVGLLNNPHVSYSHTQFSLPYESVLSIHAPFNQRDRLLCVDLDYLTSLLSLKSDQTRKICGNSEIIVLRYEIRPARLILTDYRIQMSTRRNSGKQSDPSFLKNLINGQKNHT